ESLVQQATDYAATAQADPARFQKAEADLAQARQLAIGFGVDTQAIDGKLAWVRQTSMAALGTVPRTDFPSPADAPARGGAVAQLQGDTPQQRGRMLLDKARQELRAGQNGTARRIAEEVYTGPYGIQNEAEQVLRAIDMEDFNQQLLAANRAFEEGLDAYQRQDYSRAQAIWRAIDQQKLEPQRLARMRELMQTREMIALAQGGAAAPIGRQS